ncbi:MAG TPA: hypothetical protein VN493_02710 [Thermoanaerobaculia bacterium]|nr:hypothetical protein [Thermoanaerobaculia bacterium]
MKSLLLAVILGVLLAGCYDKSDYSPTEQRVDDIVTLSSVSGATSLPADGFSRLQLEARLLGAPAFDRRMVTFSTTDGTLEGGQPVANCTGCQQVEADGSGRAVIDLISSQRVGSAVVTAAPQSAPGVTVQMTVQFGPVQPDGIIEFVRAPERAPADGATLTTYTVQVSPSIPQASRTVTFTATNGTFAPSSQTSVQVPVDAGNRASADLKSPAQIGTGRVLATVNGVTQEVSVSFDRALPNAIVVTAQPETVPSAADSKITITAMLLRNIGNVSDGTLVTFRAEAADGTPVGRFTNITRTTNGQATADFFPGAVTPGLVRVIVGAQDTNVTGSVEVEITAPGP